MSAALKGPTIRRVNPSADGLAGRVGSIGHEACPYETPGYNHGRDRGIQLESSR